MSTDRGSSRQAWIEGSTLSVGIVLAVALFGMVNYLAYRHYKRFDWTESKLYSLSEKSQKVVEGLDREVEAIIFLSPGSELYTATDELLSRYAAANPKYFKKRTIDPVKNRLEAQRLIETHSIAHSNVVVVASGDDRRVIDGYELADYDYSGTQFGQAPTLKEFKGEQLITSAILELVEAKKPRILFTTGHGEAPLDGAGDPRALNQAKDLLGKDNFELEEWDPTGKLEVPSDADLLVVAGPTTNFFPPDLELFSRYLDGGGRMLFLLDPVIRGQTLVDLGLTEWLRGYGVEVRNDVVIDPGTQLAFFGPESIYTDSFGSHPIVSELGQAGTRVLLTLARSVSKAEDAPDRFKVAELIHTTSSAWGETNLSDLENIQADEGEAQGVLSLGVAVSFKPTAAEEAATDDTVEDAAAADVAAEDAAAEDKTEAAGDAPDDGDVDLFKPDEADGAEDGGEQGKNESRLVVLGDLDFLADSQIGQAANDALTANTFNWLVEREQLISIEGKKPEETRLVLTSSELYSVYLLVLFVLPGIAVIAGVSVYMRRRR